MLMWAIGFGVASIVCISILAVLIMGWRRIGGGEVEHEDNRSLDP